jgi:membrane protein DedA with SNARE-associated domain
LIDEAKVQYAEEYFVKNGAMSTFVGRLVPAVRQLISIPAGLAGMHVGKFLFFTTLGAGIWNSVLALIGYAIYKAFPVIDTPQKVADKASEYSHIIGYAILGVVLCGLILYYIWSYNAYAVSCNIRGWRALTTFVLVQLLCTLFGGYLLLPIQ